ncbi:hypothetical protein AHAS_Ahas13G0011100 [Arachis hypogaea]
MTCQVKAELSTPGATCARESWTYAIFWQCSYDYSNGLTLLGWGEGYYKGEADKGKAIKTTSFEQQKHRKKVLRELNSLISGPSASGSWPLSSADQGENDPSSLWLNDPSSSAGGIEMVANNKTVPVVSNPGSSSVVTKAPKNLQQNQGFVLKELNFSSSLKLESGEILSFGENKKGSYGVNSNNSGNNLFSVQSQSQFVSDENKKRRSPTSRSSIEDGILSFTSGVILPASNVKSGGGEGGDSDHSDLEASVVKEAVEPEKRPRKRGKKPAKRKGGAAQCNDAVSVAGRGF